MKPDCQLSTNTADIAPDPKAFCTASQAGYSVPVKRSLLCYRAVGGTNLDGAGRFTLRALARFFSMQTESTLDCWRGLHLQFGARRMYATNLQRAALGVLVGTITGAILVAIWSFWGNTDFQYLREYWHRDALIVFTYAAFVWAAGLTIVAPGPWVMLHRNGLRSWWVAVVLGATLTFVVALGLLTDGFGLISFSNITSAADSGGPTRIDGRLTPHGWAEASKFALICSMLGAFVGLAVWRTAYRWEPPRLS